MLSFENFVKSMPPSSSELKVTPSFCFAFKIPDDVTASNNYNFYLPKVKLNVSSDPMFRAASIIPRHFWAKEFAEISEIRLIIKFIYSTKVKQFD